MVTSRRSSFVLRPRTALLVAGALAAHLVVALPGAAQAQGKPAAASSDADTKKALDLYKKGQGLHKAGKFAEALAAFRESYALVPSPNSRYYIARCLVGMNDRVGAYRELDPLITDLDARKEPKYQQTRDAAVQERTEVLAKISLLTINVANAQPSTRVTVGGADIPAAQWGKSMPYEPSSVEVVVTTSPAPPQTQRVDLRAGEKRSLDLDAKPAGGVAKPAPAPGVSTSTRAILRPVSYLAGGVGVAGMLVFAVSGGLATSTYGSLDEKCGPGDGSRPCPADAQSQINDGKVQKDVANVGLIVGAVGLAAGATLFVLSLDLGAKKEQQAPRAQAVVGPSYLGVQGTF